MQYREPNFIHLGEASQGMNLIHSRLALFKDIIDI